MISYYHKTDGNDRIKNADHPQHGSWVYVEAPSHKEIDELVSKFGLDKSLLLDALDEDEMPRLEQVDDASYIFVRFIYENNDGELRTAPLLFIFGAEHIFTVSIVRPPSLEQFFSDNTNCTTTHPAKLFLKILQQISERYDLLIKRATKQIKTIRTRMKNHEITNRDFIDFATIEDAMNDFLSSLKPTNSTLRRLQLDRFSELFEKDFDIIEDLLLNNDQSIEACNTNLKSINNIRITYSAISNANLNRHLSRLTVITLILLIPNLFFAMYGMNIPLPFQHENWALIFISAVTILVCTIFALLMRYRRPA